MKIYISGPISNLPFQEVRDNFARAEEELKKNGHEPVNPCKLQYILDPATTSWHQYMRAAFALLEVCDAVVFLPGWERSKGAVLERAHAQQYCLHVFETLDEIWPAAPQE